MSPQKLIPGIFLILISFTGTGQGSTGSKKLSYRKQMQVLAAEQIIHLHSGALLIRLKTRKNSIEALRKTGKDKYADKIESDQADINMSIIQAFKAHFDFCPVYFFLSDYSKYVHEKEFDSVQFLNENLVYDPSIQFNETKFLTAEFGFTTQDTVSTYHGYYYVPGKNGTERRKRYTSKPNMHFGALVIKSEIFIQLSRPFPYYVRTFDSLPINRKPAKVVKKLNKKLHKFLKGTNPGSERK